MNNRNIFTFTLSCLCKLIYSYHNIFYKNRIKSDTLAPFSDIYNLSCPTFLVNNNLLQLDSNSTNYPSGTYFKNLYAKNPKFKGGIFYDSLSLTVGSPAINVGDSTKFTWSPKVDKFENKRITGTNIDAGAMEGIYCKSYNTISLSINLGDSMLFNNVFIKNAGTYLDTFVNAYGCDSIITLQLSTNQPIFAVKYVSACNSYFFNNQTITQSGIYKDTFINSVSNDSIITLYLTINQTSSSNQSAVTCNSYFFRNRILTQSGVYKDTIKNSNGCDSFIILNLTINKNSFQTLNKSVCSTYYFKNKLLTQSGIYNDTLINIAGCDSIIKLNLTVLPKPMPTIVKSGLILSTQNYPTYQWFLNGNLIPGAKSKNYTALTNGNYTVSVTDMNGCDGISPVYIVSSLDINENDNKHIYKLCFNPLEKSILINSEYHLMNQVEIFSINGTPMFKNSFVNTIHIPTLTWSNGLYIVQIIDNYGNQFYYKILID